MKKTIFPLALFSMTLAYSQKGDQKDTMNIQAIQEVTLTKKVFQKKADRFVYDVANAPVAKGNTGFGLLLQAPLVSSTDDKTLQILGKSNAIIYINGSKTMMNTEAVIEMLKNMPSENISKIEIISVPGSEFDVESSDGIINIILKKNPDDGINGNVRATNNHAKVNRQSAAASLNFRKNKLGISSSLRFSNWTTNQEYLLKNGTKDYFNISEGPVNDPSQNLGGYLNIDYSLSEKQNIALLLNSNANRSYGSDAELFNTVTTPAGTTYNITQNKDDSRAYNNSANLNYQLKTDENGSKINMSIAYLNYRKFANSTNETFDSDSNRWIHGLSQRFRQETPQIINSYTAKADYLQKLKKDFTITAGGNFSKTETDNDIFHENLDLNTVTYNKDFSQSNHFVYHERIAAAYFILEKIFSDAFSAKIGTRYENTHSTGETLDTQETLKRNYNNFLPFASFNYQLNPDNSFSFAFSSRVKRPSFWEINPVRVYLTPSNYIQNNPFVKASNVYNNELTYMFKNSYFLILSHTLLKDDATQIPLQNGNELRYIRTNFGDKNTLNAFVGINKNFFKGILNSNTNAGIQTNHVKGFLDTDPITGDLFDPYVMDRTTTSFRLQSNNNIRLSSKKDLFLGVNYFYISSQVMSIGMLQPISSLDINLRKIWNDWTFVLQARDVFNTNIAIIEDIQANGNYNSVYNNGFNRNIELSVTYNFGNRKLKKMREVNDAASEINSRTGS